MTAATESSRTCLNCGTSLPADSQSTRKFCSSRCRRQSWDLANPPGGAAPARPVPFGRHIRQHFHRQASGTIYGAGHNDSKPWFGTKRCPPECPGFLYDGDTYGGPAW